MSSTEDLLVMLWPVN